MSENKPITDKCDSTRCGEVNRRTIGLQKGVIKKHLRKKQHQLNQEEPEAKAEENQEEQQQPEAQPEEQEACSRRRSIRRKC
jgi:hypothetical protein